MDIPLMAICHWPQSMTKAYGQSSKKCHWQWSMTKKLSLTMVNDKKNCHWLKVIYIGKPATFLEFHKSWKVIWLHVRFFKMAQMAKTVISCTWNPWSSKLFPGVVIFSQNKAKFYVLSILRTFCIIQNRICVEMLK